MAIDIRGTDETVPISKIVPNPWNPNVESEFMKGKLRGSLEAFGQVAEVIVRELPSGEYQIIDGEHRWTEAVGLGVTELRVRNLGLVPESSAKILTMVFNELHGDRDAKKMGALLDGLSHEPNWDEVKDRLPFTLDEIDTFIETAVEVPKTPGEKQGGGDGQPASEWVDVKAMIHQDRVKDFEARASEVFTGLGLPRQADPALDRGVLIRELLASA